MKTKILHVRMSFAIELAEAIDVRPVNLGPGQALAALDGAALAVARLLPSHLRTDPESVTICEGADVHIGLDKSGEAAPVERTPEVVLRAMLRAYEAAAETFGVAYYAAEKGAADRALARYVMADNECIVLREGLFMVRAGIEPLWHGAIGADYEARLRGDRPLDAPPMEVL